MAPAAPHIEPEEEGGPKSYLDEKAAAAAGTKGVYRVPPGGGAVELGTDLHERPNGLAFSPDFKVRHRSPVDSQESADLPCGWSDAVGGGLVDPQPDVSGYTVQADQSLGKAHTVLCQATLGAKVRIIPSSSPLLWLWKIRSKS